MCRCDGMVDVADSKSAGGDSVWVRVPPPAPPTETLGISAFETPGVSFFLRFVIRRYKRICSILPSILSYTFAQMLGAMLTTLVIFVADVLLDVVSKWA